MAYRHDPSPPRRTTLMAPPPSTSGVACLKDPSWIGKVNAPGVPQLGGEPRDLPVATRIVSPPPATSTAVGSKSCISAKLSRSRNASSSSVSSSWRTRSTRHNSV